MKSWLSLKAALAAALVFPLVALAQTDSITVTIYNKNRALINEVRSLAVPEGRQTLEFTDVAESMDPTSLQVRSLTSPEGFKILDQNYEYDLIDVPNLLNKYIGKRLKIVIPDPTGSEGARRVKEATLLANNDNRPIFRIEETGEGSSTGGGEVYVGDYDAALLPEIPEGLRPQPTLVWLVDNQGEAKQQIEVSYLAGKMNWKADYVLKVERDNTRGALSGWVTLDNQSGKSFKDARLKLVAGDVQQVPQPAVRSDVVMKRMAAPQEEEGMQEEEFFEYHLYSLGRTIDLGNRQTKQVALLQSPDVKIEKRLIGRWHGQDTYPSGSGVQKQKLGVYLEFKNSVENGLGIPLPKGIVRAYQESGDGTVIFIGEDRVDHTGKDIDVELKAGEAFDVIVERRQVEYRKVGASTVRFTWELKIKNSKEINQQVELEETLTGDWKILASNVKYEKLDAQRIKFVVDAPPTSKGQDAVVTYQAEVSW